MNIHKEGVVIVFGGLVFFMILYLLLAQFTGCNSLYCNLAGIIGLFVFSFSMFFFRNPERKIKISDPAAVYAPADGRIISIKETYESEYLYRNCIKVSIFMSIWDIHVNRYPVSGQVIYTQYHPGKNLVAFHPKSSELNEQQTVVIQKQGGVEIMVRQIAGIVARRVVSYARQDDKVQQGDDLGFIRFGSRVDIFLPIDTEILVSVKQKVKGNKTVIARF
jgi:phosphatidylserine decarboxylase